MGTLPIHSQMETDDNSHSHRTYRQFRVPTSLSCMCLDCGKNLENLEETNADTGRTWPDLESNAQPSRCHAQAFLSAMFSFNITTPSFSAQQKPPLAGCPTVGTHTLCHSVQHDCDLLILTHSALQETYEDAIGDVVPLHFICLGVHTPWEQWTCSTFTDRIWLVGLSLFFLH